jgi:nitrogen fixation/metabolism regulation signal transduction histidine kinase
MKTSIRSRKFTMGMVLFLVIILLLSVSSGYYLNRLSSKTSAILNENHYSVVYARDMSENLININQSIINCSLTNKKLDTLAIDGEFSLFNKSLKLEKNNITEIGEDALASNIEKNYNDYRAYVIEIIKQPNPDVKVLYLQKKFDNVYQQLILLSKMNEKAIEVKTVDAKISAKRFTLQMTFIGTLCFLIAYGYTFIFSSYFNDRFYRLYNGIKEVVASNYRERIHLKGSDELSEMSLIINEMVEKLDKEDKTKVVSID